MGIMKKKSVQVAVTVALAAGIILAGTFAWFSFTQNALNVMEGIANPGGNLHDDFEQGEPNKDVYVENSGSRPIYVRVRMDEFMDIDEKSLIPGASRGDLSSWNPHKYLGASVDNCGEEFHDYYQWVMGSSADDPDAGFKFYLPAPFANQARFDSEGKQTYAPIAVTYENNNETMGAANFVAKYGVDEHYTEADLQTGYDAYQRVNALLYETDPDTGAVTDSALMTQLKALYADLDAADSTAARKAAQTAIDTFLKNNNLGYWDKVYTVSETGAINDGPTSTEGTDYTIQFIPMRRTQTTAQIYTMAQWIAAGTPTGEFWILDNDGWAYWGDVIQPGAATGLLLSEVVLKENNKPAGSWYYGINVKLQAVTYDDINLFGMSSDQQGGGGITDQGMMVLQAASGNYVFDMQNGKTGPNDPVFTFVNNKDNTFRLMTSDGANKKTYDSLFVYTGPVPPVTTGDIYGNGTLMGDSAYQVGKTFKKDIPFGAANVEFTIVDAGYGSGVLEGHDSKHYIKLSYQNAEGADTTAWLAVGADKQFDPLTKGTAPDTAMYSAGDDVLVWTTAAEPGMTEGADRFVEDESTAYKIGDTFKKDSIDWVIIGIDTKADSATTGKTLIISKDVLDANIANGAITTTLDGYNETKLAELAAANDGTAVTAQLLTIQDAMDYFADNAARTATTSADATANAKWWLDNGIVAANGALGAKDESATDVGIRVAFWMESAKVQDMLYPTTTP